MQLSFLISEGNKDVVSIDVPVKDITYDEFLNVVSGALGLKKGTNYDVTVDGKTYTKDDVIKAGGSVNNLNLKENDLLILSPKVELNLIDVDANERTNLIRSVIIPKSKYQRNEESVYARDAMGLYRQLRSTNARRLEHVRPEIEEQLPGLMATYDSRPNDKWAFLISYRNGCLRREAEKKRLGSVAVQRDMEKKRQRERLEQNMGEAMTETPEAFVHIEMLYISIKLNGVEGKAFIDTGAAKSLISREFAEKCNLTELINPHTGMIFRGVGGHQQSDGTIWRCDMTVGDHELPVTLHVMPKGQAVHEVLFGLDLLLRHRANIDLQTRTLSFHGGVSTPFLSDVESAKIREDEQKAHGEEPMETEEAVQLPGGSQQQ